MDKNKIHIKVVTRVVAKFDKYYVSNKRKHLLCKQCPVKINN